jgi:23S rRNA pseudouridine2605 synthase
VRYGPIEGTLDKPQEAKPQGSNVWLKIGLREGKNREVRTILEHLGLTVNRLIRVSFGPFQLLDLQPGDAEAVKRRVLIEQLGARTAAALGITDEAGGNPQRRHPAGPRGRKPKADELED